METARSMDRRSFLKGATVAGAAAAAAGTLGLAGCAPQDKETVAAASGDLVLDAEKFTNAKWNFEIPPEPVDESKIGNTVECEILVIGAGVGGLVTATSAVEEGADVVVIASSDGPVSRGGSNAAFNTRLTHELGLDFTREEIEPIFQEIFASNSFRLDQEKWWLVYNESGNAMNWLMDKMEPYGISAVIENNQRDGGTDWWDGGPLKTLNVSHSFVAEGAQAAGASQQIVVEALTEEIQKGGGQVFFSTTAVQLDREGDNTGRVTGCVAKHDGEYTRYKATKGVVLATMGDEVLPCRWWAEGALTTFPGLLVNKKGVRYSNENCTYGYMPYPQRVQPDGCAFLIWDENWVQDSAPWQSDRVGGEPRDTQEVYDAIQALFDPNTDWTTTDEYAGFDATMAENAVKADTLEELADGLGLPREEFLAQVERYNSYCETGLDDEFHKDKRFLLPVKQPPFYGIKNEPYTLCITGGLNTDIQMHVCDSQNDPIPGLYGVGTVVGDMYGDVYDYKVPGINLGGACTTFGYLLGKNLSAGKW